MDDKQTPAKEANFMQAACLVGAIAVGVIVVTTLFTLARPMLPASIATPGVLGIASQAGNIAVGVVVVLGFVIMFGGSKKPSAKPEESKTTDQP